MGVENNDSCSQRESAERKGYVRAHRSFNRIWKERDSAEPDILSRILDKDNLNRAYKRVKANKGAPGVDGMTIEEALPWLKENHKELVERIRKGKYTPSPVRRVEIPKPDGGTRKLGIPTVEDRIAQMVAKMYFEPLVEPMFYSDSYGYRPNKSAIQAVGQARERCFKRDWVLELDIKGLFDNIKHGYLMYMVEKHTQSKWLILYIKRWLTVPFIMSDGTNVERKAGTPQGGVISPVLANLFMHYVFDDYMSKAYPYIWWERYADDGVLHCQSYKQAVFIKQKLEERFQQFGLELNKEKTRIVYCKDKRRTQNYSCTQSTFLGYTFRPRLSKSKAGEFFVGFAPAVSEKAKTAMKQKIREWKIQLKVNLSLKDIGDMINKVVQGWINYYTHYYKSEFYEVLRYINQCLIKWVRRRFIKRNTRSRAEHWLGAVARRDRDLFAHWKFGILPAVGEGAV